MEKRKIKRAWKVSIKKHTDSHSSGFVIEPGHWEEFDPFLLMAEDYFKRGTFGPHPHRGMETVTYVIDGVLEHEDNKGGAGTLYPGDAQWMTAGKGVIHSEEPAIGETVHSLQLWVNLPSDKKMTEPRYQNLLGKEMPIRVEHGVSVKVFSGSSGDVQSKTQNHVPITMVEINLEKGATFAQDIPPHYNGFIVILAGAGTFGSNGIEGTKGDVLLLERIEGDGHTEVDIVASEPLRILLYAGQPVHEPVVARGPFVMNTEEEIKQAYSDFRNGKFI